MKRYIFPEPLDSKCVLMTDGGVEIVGQLDTHPVNGAPCQSYTIPPEVPNSHGATERIEHAGLVKIQLHGILMWGSLLPSYPPGQAAMTFDVFPLQSSFPVNPPTRAEVIGVRTHFLGGLIVDAPQYGKMPWLDPALPWCNAETRQEVYWVT